MTIRILELRNGHISLEFDTNDIPVVAAGIKSLFGDATQEQFVLCSSIGFGGSEFIFQNEWDDPCLISTTVEGDECLRRLHGQLTDRQG